jgi:hypothetical protein
MTMKCIDLKREFGDHYRVECEPSYYAQSGSQRASNRNAWLYVIPCRHGEIFPWEGRLLAISTKRRGAIATRLKRLSCTEMKQDGDDGMTLTFHEDDFPTIADIVKPRRRPQLSDERRQALSQQMTRLNQRRNKQSTSKQTTSKQSTSKQSTSKQWTSNIDRTDKSV